MKLFLFFLCILNTIPVHGQVGSFTVYDEPFTTLGRPSPLIKYDINYSVDVSRTEVFSDSTSDYFFKMTLIEIPSNDQSIFRIYLEKYVSERFSNSFTLSEFALTEQEILLKETVHGYADKFSKEVNFKFSKILIKDWFKNKIAVEIDDIIYVVYVPLDKSISEYDVYKKK